MNWQMYGMVYRYDAVRVYTDSDTVDKLLCGISDFNCVYMSCTSSSSMLHAFKEIK